MPDFILRSFVTADIPPALALWQSTEGIGLTGADSPAALTNFLHRNPGLSRVALIDDQLVGAVLCGHDGRRGFLYHLAVAAPHQRQGIGRTLAEDCVTRLQRCGVERVTIHVFAHNPQGAAFWRARAWRSREDLLVLQIDAK
jgi:N-acetylglutamate synthase